MKRTLSTVSVVLFFLPTMMLSQARLQPPKAGPEHKRLHYFVGRWQTEGDMKQSPFGPPGKFTGTDRNAMLAGGFFLVMHSDGKGPLGEMRSLEVMGYNADEKVYTFNGFDNWGMAETSKGTVNGDTWTWNSETKWGGKAYKARFILKEVSPTSYTFNYDISEDGTWKNVMEGKATKAK